MPKISVVIPCYNSATTIQETIESVLVQTYRDFEIIVVDDGSTDGSKEMIHSYGDQVRYFYQPNAGQAAARNKGIREAKGEYIAFLDADDLWLPEKLDKQIQVLSTRNVDWCYCDCMNFEDETGKELGRYSQLMYAPAEGIVAKKILFGNFIASPTPVVKKELLIACGLFDESISIRSREDWELWLRLAVKSEIAYLSEVLAKRRIHKSSITYMEDPQKAYESHVAVIKKIVTLYPAPLMDFCDLAIAHYAARFSRSHWLAGNMKQAKQLIHKAIDLEPGKLAYRLIRMTYILPYPLVHAGMTFRNSIRAWFRK